jgi:DNA repair protein RAD5
MADASDPPLEFFTSDDETDTGGNTPAETVPSEPELGGPPSQASSEGPATHSPLFLPDEDDTDRVDFPLETLRSVSIRPDGNPVDDVGMSDIFGIPEEKGLKPAAKRQPEGVFEPKKRRKLSPSCDYDFTSAFLGSIVVPNAWSTVKGNGYIKNGDPILVEYDRLKQEDELPKKGDKKKLPKKKGKQLTITTLMKPRQDNFKKQKQNAIVRLTNRGGFGGFAYQLPRTGVG